ncbi:MAG: M1 family aminopeptidase, partial [Bacteroidota bacterium]
QTMSSMGGFTVGLTAHEVAHQWFGNQITLRTWPHLWLNEGFASYAELLYWEAEHPENFRPALTRHLQRALTAPGTLIVSDTLDIGNLFNYSRVYAKGSAVLHMLRRIVGDETFRAILHAYASEEDLSYDSALTEDFQHIAERTSGLDLDTFFRQWVTHGTGHPVYQVRWTVEGAEEGSYVARVTIEQTQSLPSSNVEAFEMPVTLAFETSEGEKRVTVQNSQRTQTYEINLDALPEALLFDPDLDLLRNLDVMVTSASIPPQEQSMAILDLYPNPASTALFVSLSIPEPGSVRLALYDTLGRRIRTVEEAVRPRGRFEEAFDLNGIAAGTYLLRLEHEDGQSVVRPFVVVRGGQ